MNRDELVALAWKVGLMMPEKPTGEMSKLEHFAALVAAIEREECAKVCEALSGKGLYAGYCASAIRARGKS